MNDFMDLLQYIEESHTFKEAVFSYSDKEDKKAEFTNFMVYLVHSRHQGPDE